MLLNKLLRTSLQGMRVTLWRLTHANYLLVFNWHQVGSAFNPNCHHEYTWTPLDDFERETKWLAAGFKVLPLAEAISRIKNGRLQGACAALTFDDGDVSVAEQVEPVLSKHNLPATFFINTAYLEAQKSYWFPIVNYFQSNAEAARATGFSQELQEAALKLRRTSDPVYYNEWRTRIEVFAPMVLDLTSHLVSIEWLSKLDGDQFAIGAHGGEHQRFSMMSAKWQRDDLRENVRILSQFRAFKPIFAIPFGREYDWTDETLKIASSLGLEVVLADGGVNISPGKFYRRIPGDGKKLRPLIRNALARQ